MLILIKSSDHITLYRQVIIDNVFFFNKKKFISFWSPKTSSKPKKRLHISLVILIILASKKAEIKPKNNYRLI
jgi:hypothetical protein